LATVPPRGLDDDGAREVMDIRVLQRQVTGQRSAVSILPSVQTSAPNTPRPSAVLTASGVTPYG
jgi:hypothetical protein